jgi:hypothetical protein
VELSVDTSELIGLSSSLSGSSVNKQETGQIDFDALFFLKEYF